MESRRFKIRKNLQLDSSIDPRCVNSLTRTETLSRVKKSVSTAGNSLILLLSNSMDEGVIEDDHEHDYVNYLCVMNSVSFA